MPLKDLRGKSICDLDLENFEKLFYQRCQEYDDCPRDDRKILGCTAFVDTGLWDSFYSKDKSDSLVFGLTT